MGKYLPIESTPVTAFQWKIKSETCVFELIKYLRDENIDFELIAENFSVSIMVGDCNDASWPGRYAKVLDMHWFVIEEDRFATYTTTQFFEKYQS